MRNKKIFVLVGIIILIFTYIPTNVKVKNEHEKKQINDINGNIKLKLAVTWTVDDDLQDYPFADFTKIQEAVEAASAGDTIIVYPGLYIEYVNVYYSLNIKSVGGAEVTVIRASHPYYALGCGDGFINITGFTIGGATVGIRIYGSDIKYCNISQNIVLDNDYGIVLSYASNNIIADNIVSNSKYVGIEVDLTSNQNIIDNNTVFNNQYSIQLSNAPNNTLTNNTVFNNKGGITIKDSPNLTLKNNRIFNNTVNNRPYDFGIGGSVLSDFIHNIDTSNMVNGKPIQYLLSKKNLIIDSNYNIGYLAIVNCKNIIIRDLELISYSIDIAFTSNSRIENVKYSNLRMWSSSYNIISKCEGSISLINANFNKLKKNIAINKFNGIYLKNSSNNIIYNNTIVSNEQYGIFLRNSSNNILTANTILLNGKFGLFIREFSNENIIYFNNILENQGNIGIDYQGANVYNIYNSIEEITYIYNDQIYSSYIGNYWSDYAGIDSNNDGVGDTPYNIYSTKYDNYPLMEPFENYEIKTILLAPPPNYLGLSVDVVPKTEGPYYINDIIEFEVIITNPTDTTGINIIAYDVWFTVDPPDGIETNVSGYIIGDIAPGESKSKLFEATAKKAGENVEILVNAYGEDYELGIPITGSGHTVIGIYDPGAERPDWSFAIITDLHIGFTPGSGDDYFDYDGFGIYYNKSEGWKDGTILGQDYYLTRELEQIVETIKDAIENYNIKFVVVLGDISDTAELSEFLKAREILNRLNDKNIPYIPLLGNHDVWPYMLKPGMNHDKDRKPEYCWTIADPRKGHKLGDELFEEVFWNKSDENIIKNIELIEALPDWEKMDSSDITILVDPPDSEPINVPIYLQNYAFSYGEIRFICSDYAARVPPGDWRGGLACDFPGYPTLKWRSEHEPRQGEIGIHFSHFPDALKSKEKYLFAGHVHGNPEYNWRLNFLCGVLGCITTESVSRYHDMSHLFTTNTGKNIRIVNVTGDQIDYSTLLMPRGESIDLLYPTPFFTSQACSYPEPNGNLAFEAHAITYHGYNISFNWDFGDGNFGNGQIIIHNYSQEGEYNVTLTITSKNLITKEETSEIVRGTIYVLNKYKIYPLPSNLNVTSFLTGEDVTKVAKNTNQHVLLTKMASEDIPIARFLVFFEQSTENIDFSNLIADIDLVKGKSIVYMPSWSGGVEEYKFLYIPSTGIGSIYICLDATSLDEVNLKKADLIINVGETKEGITVTTTFYNGKEYYLVSGLISGGGGELKESHDAVIPGKSSDDDTDDTEIVNGYESFIIVGSIIGISLTVAGSVGILLLIKKKKQIKLRK